MPLPDGAVAVVISNCVINLSTDKPAVTTSYSPSGPIVAPMLAASPEPDIVAATTAEPTDSARGGLVGMVAAEATGTGMAGGGDHRLGHAATQAFSDSSGLALLVNAIATGAVLAALICATRVIPTSAFHLVCVPSHA